MKEDNLKTVIEAIDELNITPEMQQNIIREVKRQTTGRGSRHPHHGRRQTQYGSRLKPYKMQRVAAGIAISAVAVCAVGFPVRAYVLSLVQERMEKLPQEEVKEIVQTIDEQQTEADSFSREYRETERERMKELQMAYQSGTFPAGELLQVEKEEDALQYEFCFVKPISRFCLPERDLTDEELLRIIDFNAKRDFSLQQRYEEEFADEIKARQEKEEAAKAEIRARGGVNESEALEIAKAWLHSLFGTTEEGREINSYLDTDREPLRYVITFSIQSCEYYYFFIDAADGTLREVSYTSAGDYDSEMQSIREIQTQIPVTYDLAEKFLQDKMGIYDVYEHAYCFYYTHGEKVDSNRLQIQFVQADGTAYFVSMNLNGKSISYEVTNYAEYQEQLAEAEKLHAERVKRESAAEDYDWEITHWETVQIY